MPMIPIYTAQEFIDILPNGRTRPWVAMVDVDGIPTPYVLKLYSKNEHNSDILLREIICHYLARQFDFRTPDIAFIDTYDPTFKNSLKKDQANQLKLSGYKPKFATRLIEPTLPILSRRSNVFLDINDKENLYAFDSFLLNTDRRKDKPNAFINDKQIYLIDHEYAFTNVVKEQASIEGNTWEYYYANHLFYKDLKRYYDKSEFFTTFTYYLDNHMDTRVLYDLPYFLSQLKYPSATFEDLISYLNRIKELSSRFKNLLLHSINR